MQTVSQKWLDNHKKTILDESFIEVSIDITDPDAIVDVLAEDNGAHYLSETETIVNGLDKEIPSYATLERNLWLLDGSRKIIPTSDYGDNGYISSVLCRNDGYFTEKPRITLNFSKVHKNIIPGITIEWGVGYNEYPTSFTVSAYNGDTLVASKSTTDNTTVRSLIFVDIINYDRIVIEVNKWCIGHHRARIGGVLVGINKVYDKSDLFKFSHNQSVDPLSTTLPKMDISFAINNTDNAYNPYNKEGMSKYLIERQEVKARYGLKVADNEVEWIDGGTFYLSSWDAPQGGMSADFTARDLLEFMLDTYYEGVYSEEGVSLYDLATRVLEKANLPLNSDGSVKWIIDDTLKTIYTNSAMPVDTLANCLQLIANAGECVLYQDRRGILHIERINDNDTDYKITNFNSYSKSEISLSKPLKQVEVKLYQSFTGDSAELYKGKVTVNGTEDVVVTYSAPARNVVVTVDNGILNSGTVYENACLLNITAEGEVDILVTGNRVETTTVSVITPNDINGEIVSVDNPLITSTERAISVGRWVRDYMKNRTSLQSSWRVDPRLDVLDIVSNVNDYNTNRERVYDVSFDYNGSFKGTAEGKVIG